MRRAGRGARWSQQNVALRGRAALAALAFLWTCSAAALTTPPEHRRSEDQTYLTFPEWFLVHSPAEAAAFLQHGDAHRFPWLAHVGQMWTSYGAVIDATRAYPFNGEYHTMIGVIATSTTVEYGLKGLYEGTIGRLAALTRGAQRTPEDEFTGATMQRYVDFIRDRPWYEFDFIGELRALWRDVPWSGGGWLRKLERRFALTSEFLVKAAYGKLIEFGTRSSFTPPKPVTAAIVRPAPVAGVADVVVLDSGDGAALATLPRYYRFRPTAQQLARAGGRFEEIAGNRKAILVSVLTNEPAAPAWASVVRIEQPILTRPGWRRLAVDVPIAQLHEALASERASLVIEHVYDF